MERKYQVFISSTYQDLVEERKRISNTLLMADCIPAGMEAFVATDDEQFNIIKKVIDCCDFYILVIGTRYGSINNKTGKSYTEMEYEYALSLGIPILVFAKNVDLDTVINEESSDSKTKLKEFREKVLKDRLGSMWTTLDDLTGKVAISIMKAKEEFKRPGWIRNLGFDPDQVIAELNYLKDKVIRLEKENVELKKIGSNEEQNKEDLFKYKMKLHYTEQIFIFTSTSPPPKEIVIDTTLGDIFKHISVRINGRLNDKDFIKAINSFKSGYLVDTQEALIIKSQLIALGMLTEIEDGGNAFVKLSEIGKQEMQRLNAPVN